MRETRDGGIAPIPSVLGGSIPFEAMKANRRMTRRPKNNQDRCTVVSIYEKRISERKFTIEPGLFELQPGTFDKPSILVVGSSSWWQDLDPNRPLIEIPTGSVGVANAIVKDYCNGMLACDMKQMMPGLFFVEGAHTVKDIKEKFFSALMDAKLKQDKWFARLVNIADSLWARSNNNPLAISDEMRLAAQSIGASNKPWLSNYALIELVPCKACGYMRNPTYPVCSQCKNVDSEHPLSKDLKFAV